MTASLTAPKPAAAPAAKTTSLSASMIDFNQIYTGLAAEGITLNDKEKERFEKITLEEIERSAGPLSNLAPDNLLYFVFAFLAKLFNPTQPLNGSNLAEHLGNSVDGTSDLGKLRGMKTAMENVYERLRHEGGTLAAIAEKTTQTAVGHAPEVNGFSIYTQALAGMNMVDADTNIAAQRLPDVRQQTTNSSLTPAG